LRLCQRRGNKWRSVRSLAVLRLGGWLDRARGADAIEVGSLHKSFAAVDLGDVDRDHTIPNPSPQGLTTHPEIPRRIGQCQKVMHRSIPVVSFNALQIVPQPGA